MGRQTGATFIGMLFIAALVIFFAIIAMKLVPSYVEYWSVEKIMSAMAKDPALQGMSPSEIRNSFDKRADIDDVTSVKGSDLDISRENGKPVVGVAYSVKVHLFGNVNACLDFSASTGS